MRRLALIVALAALCVQTPARAAGDGCIAVGTHVFVPQQPWSCHYLANGPGTFVAATVNPFVIYAERAGHAEKIILARRSVLGRPTSGKIATRPGDEVYVSISCWDYAGGKPCASNSTTGGRNGVLIAQSHL